ncbi:hypothetical protein VCRA2133E348_390026 [Vibrio crassostreae]|nr:hypothetical protein VCRA2133E348_390026 [Vibrio crassostreae]CAK3449904.1 hypothetical protein VCRA213O314_420021 [Vibrio crassostreae]
MLREWFSFTSDSIGLLASILLLKLNFNRMVFGVNMSRLTPQI